MSSELKLRRRRNYQHEFTVPIEPNMYVEYRINRWGIVPELLLVVRGALHLKKAARFLKWRNEEGEVMQTTPWSVLNLLEVNMAGDSIYRTTGSLHHALQSLHHPEGYNRFIGLTTLATMAAGRNIWLVPFFISFEDVYGGSDMAGGIDLTHAPGDLSVKVGLADVHSFIHDPQACEAEMQATWYIDCLTYRIVEYTP